MTHARNALLCGILIAAVAMVGCESGGRTTSTSSSTRSGGTDATGAMIDSDTQVAKDELDDRRGDSRADGPVAPRDRRSGSGVVDQPRVVPPPANKPVRR